MKDTSLAAYSSWQIEVIERVEALFTHGGNSLKAVKLKSPHPIFDLKFSICSISGFLDSVISRQAPLVFVLN